MRIALFTRVAIFSLSSVGLWAQVGSTVINGSVRDSSGASAPNASVQLKGGNPNGFGGRSLDKT